MAVNRYEIAVTPTQQEMVDFIVSRGWKLDTTRTINTHRGWGFNQLTADEQASFKEQHPFAFVRTGSDGGRQTLRLDYPSDYTPFGKTLRSASFEWHVPNSDRVRRVTIRKPSSWIGADYIWMALAVCGDKTTIRQRVTAFAADPEGSIRRADELKKRAEDAERAAAEERARDRAARAAVPTGWWTLQSAAKDVVHSDGLSDHAALVEALKAALAAVEPTVVR